MFREVKPNKLKRVRVVHVRGSNQYKKKYVNWRKIRAGFAVFSLAITFLYIAGNELYQLHGNKPYKLVSPLPVYAKEVEPTLTATPLATPTQTPVQVEIRNYIKDVFGEDADLAFQVLSCENSALRPDAVNTVGNSPEGSRDIGVFQINEYWQKTQGKFLFNWKINVEIAHQLFEENGKSFKLWTCGRKLGL